MSLLTQVFDKAKTSTAAILLSATMLTSANAATFRVVELGEAQPSSRNTLNIGTHARFTAQFNTNSLIGVSDLTPQSSTITYSIRNALEELSVQSVAEPGDKIEAAPNTADILIRDVPEGTGADTVEFKISSASHLPASGVFEDADFAARAIFMTYSDSTGATFNNHTAEETIAILSTNPLAFDGVELLIKTGADLQTEAFETITNTQAAGDYDYNGIVETADYTVWRNNYGITTIAGTGVDGNGDGSVDAADYTVWRDHLELTESTFGSQGTNIPEPPAIMIIAAALLPLSKTRHHSPHNNL